MIVRLSNSRDGSRAGRQDLLSYANNKGQLVLGRGQRGGWSLVQPQDSRFIAVFLVTVFQEVLQALKL